MNQEIISLRSKVDLQEQLLMQQQTDIQNLINAVNILQTK